jgi:NitT/TauT family transport system substrate-binding protein
MRLRAVVIISVAMTLASGPALSQTPVSTEKVKLVVGLVAMTPSFGGIVLVGGKLWKPYLPNVDVERYETMSGMPLVNNMLADKVDIAYLGDMPSIVLGSKSALAQSYFIGLTEADDGEEVGIIVKKGSPIKSVKELAGKTVSVPFGGFTHRFAEVVMTTDGIKFKFVGQSPEVGLSNLQAGKVDAYMPWNPFGRLAVLRGFGEKITDGKKYNFSSLRAIVVRKTFYEKHPDVVAGWMRAELDAHQLARSKPDVAAKLIFDDWKKFDVPLEVIRNDFSYKIFPDDIPDKWRKVMVDSAQFLLSHKYIEKAPDWASFFNEAPIKKAASIPSQMK